MFKPFFIHFNRPARKTDNSRLRHHPRGFTAFVQPTTEARKVRVSGAFCSAKDEFIKSEGRSLAQHPDTVFTDINPRDLPKLLGSMKAVCYGDKHVAEEEYFYVLKYVI